MDTALITPVMIHYENSVFLLVLLDTSASVSISYCILLSHLEGLVMGRMSYNVAPSFLTPVIVCWE